MSGWLAGPSDAPHALPNPLPPPALPTEAARAVYRQLTDGLQSARLARHAALGEYAGIEWRLPFLDLELVEFVLGLPQGLAFRDGQTKRLLRLAMAGVLPEPVRQRRTFARFTELTQAGLTNYGRGRITDLLVEPLTTRDSFVQYAALLMTWNSLLGVTR